MTIYLYPTRGVVGLHYDAACQFYKRKKNTMHLWELKFRVEKTQYKIYAQCNFCVGSILYCNQAAARTDTLYLFSIHRQALISHITVVLVCVLACALSHLHAAPCLFYVFKLIKNNHNNQTWLQSYAGSSLALSDCL